MEKFIKKLINRLEEQSGKEEQEMNYYRELSEEDASCEVFADAHEKKYEAYCNAIGIVYEIAEEYNNESVKGDLISRSDVMRMLTNMELSCTIIPITEAKLQLRDIPSTHQADNNGWIPCSERLPDIEADVMLSLRSLDVYTGFRANTEGCFYVEGEGYVEFENVLAWQPLPQPYQPKGDSNV